MDNNLTSVRIRVFRADKSPDECQRYIEGHRKVLEAYGVTQVTSANLDWLKESFTYIIMVESATTGEALGGARLQLTGGAIPLPIETAIDKMDPRISEFVKEKKQSGTTCEYCGLWNSRKIAGYGVGSILLVRIGIAMLSQLNVGSIFAFCSPATVPISMSVGYSIIRSIGINGTFYYPKEDLLATALIIEDPLTLNDAEHGERDKIFDLRKNPKQRIIEHGRRGEIEVTYDLRMP
ncbi:MAG: hypothetical protein ACRDE2_11105, partial [Chitinophagaceae bacterium]